MLKLILCTIALATTIACSPQQHTIITQDQELADHVNHFIAEAAKHSAAYMVPANMVVKKVEMPIGTLGTCTISTSGLTVKLNTIYWKYISKAKQTQVIFHELSHCLLNMDHYDTEVDIMNTSENTDFNDENAQEYIQKLFNRYNTRAAQLNN